VDNLSVAIQYAQDCLNNTIPAGNLIKLACQRFLDDIENPLYYVDEDELNTIVDFCESFDLTEVSPPRKMILQSWQKWLLANFNIYNKDTLQKKHRFVLVEIGRGNGKTQLCALLSIYELLYGSDAQIIIAGNTTKSTMEVDFDKIRKLVYQIDPKQKQIKVFYNKITYKTNKLIVSSNESKPIDGMSGSLMLVDEMHLFGTSNVYAALRSSMVKRTDNLLFVISTAGFSKDSDYFKLREYGIGILNGDLKDDSQFVALYGVDSVEEIFTDEKSWYKPNPNLGISVNIDAIRTEVNKAKLSSIEKPQILVKNFNVWMNLNSDVWIEEDYINASMQNISIDEARFSGLTCYFGVDLGSVSDLTCAVALIILDDKFYFFPHFWLPEDSVNNNHNKQLFVAANMAHEIELTSGNVTDYRLITKYLLEFDKHNPIIEVSYDKWNSVSWATETTEAGLNLKPFSQLPSNLNKPLKGFEHLIKSGNLIIQKNTLAVWCLNNVQLLISKMGNYSINKESKNKKIDFVAAAINALGVAIENANGNLNVW
jgi:phage terminase large subunit-like protein